MGYKVNRKDPGYRLLVSRLGNILYGLLFNLWFRDANCGFRLIKKIVAEDIVDSLHSMPYACNAEFAIRAKHKGYKVVQVPVQHYASPKSNVFSIKKMPSVILKQLIGLMNLRLELWKR